MAAKAKKTAKKTKKKLTVKDLKKLRGGRRSSGDPFQPDDSYRTYFNNPGK